MLPSVSDWSEFDKCGQLSTELLMESPSMSSSQMSPTKKQFTYHGYSRVINMFYSFKIKIKANVTYPFHLHLCLIGQNLVTKCSCHPSLIFHHHPCIPEILIRQLMDAKAINQNARCARNFQESILRILVACSRSITIITVSILV